MPTISVLMPVFNGCRFLRKAIDSILGQTFGDFEFLIIDDGSTDGSIEIVKSYTDSRIKLVRNPHNCGIVYSLNRGLQIAKGEYIARMDCDDISLPDRFQVQVDFLQHHPGIGLCGSWILDLGRFRKRIWKAPSSSGAIQCYFPFKNPIVHPAVMMRKRMLSEWNLCYRACFPHVEDLDLWRRCARFFEIRNIERVLLHYRRHGQSISYQHRTVQKQAANRIQKEILKQSGLLTSGEVENALDAINRWPRLASWEAVLTVQYWLNRLYESNQEKGVFPEPEFSQMLAWLWFRECFAARKLGKNLRKIYETFCLKDAYQPDRASKWLFWLRTLV